MKATNFFLAMVFCLAFMNSRCFAQSKVLVPTVSQFTDLSSYLQAEDNLQQLFKLPIDEQKLNLIALNDSNYQWQLNTAQNEWQLTSKNTDFVYDANNNLLSSMQMQWNGISWVNSGLTTYTYDANNNNTITKTYSWNGTSWENHYQYLSTYDANNNPLSYLTQSWNDTVWENWGQSSYTYDIYNNQVGYIHQSWQDTAWVNDSRVIKTYDADNYLINYISQTWDSIAWVNYSKYIYTYNTNNLQSGYSTQIWNGSVWENSGLTTITYDANNNLNIVTGLSWNGTSWENHTLWTFNYDSIYFNSYLLQLWKNNNWIKYMDEFATNDADNFRISSAYRQYDTTGTVVQFGDSIYYYYHTAVGLNEISSTTETINTFPNPTNGKIYIQIKGNDFDEQNIVVELYNILNERILQTSFSNSASQNEIDLSEFQKGIYVLRIFEGEKIISKKIVLQ
jgi:hypothetical protein